MATLRQKKLARNIVENIKRIKPLNKGELVESSGYSKISAKSSAGIILEQIGVQEELEKLGFSVDGADKVVSNILYQGKKEENKLKAADLVYKRRGAYEDTKQGSNKTLVINISGETATRYGVLPHTDTENSRA